MLSIFSRNNEIFAVTVYGAGHYWLDNIAQWNRDYPDEKFSLIEIVPKGLEEFAHKELPSNNIIITDY